LRGLHRHLPVAEARDPNPKPQQAADGGFRNPSNLVKEDDPLIATAFALYVLGC